MSEKPRVPATAPEGASPGRARSRRGPRPRAWLIRGGAVIGLALAGMAALALWWSREPPLFDVEQVARDRAIASAVVTADEPLPPGYTSVSTLIAVMETLLHKPGGYLYNDRFPPGALLDNIPNWEFGALMQVRDFTTTLRQDLSRTRAQSEERPELSEAEARFSYEHNAWMFPSAEGEYEEGLAHLRRYLDALGGVNGNRAVFAGRPDSLVMWLRRVESRLGGLAVRLRASSGVYRYDPKVLTSEDLAAAPASESPDAAPDPAGERTPRLQVDDVFFEARGAAWTLYHLLKAIRYDLQPVIDQQRAMGSVNRALSELYAALQPLEAPMVLNGEDFGMAPNHSITLAAYLAKAHLAVADLRAVVGGATAP